MTLRDRQKKTKDKAGRASLFIGAAIAVIVLLMTALVIFTLTSSKADPETPAVLLPTPLASDSLPINTEDIISNMRRAEVTTDTVQAVIATLSRADSYTRTVTVERFSSGGGSSSSITAWVRGESSRISVNDGAVTKNILLQNGEIWIWYSDSPGYYRGAAKGGVAMADEYQKMLSYEDILELDPDSITDAGYVEFNGEQCIFAEYVTESLGYRNMVYISVGTGILMGNDEFDGDALIYRMVSDAPDISTPSDEIFAPPE